MKKQYLDLSTGHLPAATYLTLIDPTTQWPVAMSIAPYHWGCFVSVPPLSYEDILTAARELPEGLFEVLVYADEQRCEIIRFDGDGGTVPALRHYDW